MDGVFLIDRGAIAPETPQSHDRAPARRTLNLAEVDAALHNRNPTAALGKGRRKRRYTNRSIPEAAARVDNAGRDQLLVDLDRHLDVVDGRSVFDRVGDRLADGEKHRFLIGFDHAV
ncbi:MAG TPA: hypothetical protein VF741_04590 [Candidatus Aquilonibacter sp.]